MEVMIYTYICLKWPCSRRTRSTVGQRNSHQKLAWVDTVCLWCALSRVLRVALLHIIFRITEHIYNGCTSTGRKGSLFASIIYWVACGHMLWCVSFALIYYTPQSQTVWNVSQTTSHTNVCKWVYVFNHVKVTISARFSRYGKDIITTLNILYNYELNSALLQLFLF